MSVCMTARPNKTVFSGRIKPICSGWKNLPRPWCRLGKFISRLFFLRSKEQTTRLSYPPKNYRKNKFAETILRSWQIFHPEQMGFNPAGKHGFGGLPIHGEFCCNSRCKLQLRKEFKVLGPCALLIMLSSTVKFNTIRNHTCDRKFQCSSFRIISNSYLKECNINW